MIYEAEIINDRVIRVIASPAEGWAAENLGGTWEKCGNKDASAGPVPFVGAGYFHDPGLVEKFVADVWTNEKATTPDSVSGLYYYRTNGQLTWYQGRAWRNLMPNGNPNVWEPPTNWREYPMGEEHPLWVKPSGAVDAYTMDFIVEHKSDVWRSTLNANVWEPGVSGWEKIV